MKRQFFSFAFSAVLASGALAQGHVDGYVVDAVNGEALPSAYVRLAGAAAGSVSNAYGFFALPASARPDTIVVSFVGYETLRLPIAAGARSGVRLGLTPVVRALGEVTVSAPGSYRAELKSPAMSHHRLSGEQVRRTVMMFGEPDALKNLQLMPGINSAADGSTNLSVRGGSHDQNLILLDEAVVFNPSHAMGLVSAFNTDAVLDVNIYKGAIPARYGGRLSSVVDMRMREGDSRRFRLRGGVGTTVSRLMVEGPIKKDTASFVVSGRYGQAWLVHFAQLFADQGGIYSADNDRASFGDYTAKLNWRVGERDRLYASAYASHDAFNFQVIQAGTETKWANKTATLRWNHAFSQNVFANTTVTASQYDYRQEQRGDVLESKWTARMGEIDAKVDLDHYAGTFHLQYGGGFEAHRYEPGTISPTSARSAVKRVSMGNKRMGLGFVYFGASRAFAGERLVASLGVRMSLAPQIGPATVYHYADPERTVVVDSTRYGGGRFVKTNKGIEPRLGLSYSFAEWATVKASYSRTKQFQHLLTNSALSLPTDIWTPADHYAKPQTSNAVALGLHTFFDRPGIEASAEAYMKWIDDIIDFRDGAVLRMNNHYESLLLPGRGRARGLELMVAKDAQRYALSVAYTLSEAKRQVDGVNGGAWYYERFDQRHNLGVSALFRATRRLELSAVFRYHTGGRTTLPEKVFTFQGGSYATYSERNGYVMPDYHRLDISAKLAMRQRKHWDQYMLFACANVYGRKNAYSMFTKGNPENRTDFKLYKMYIFQWVPSITYVFALK